MEVLVGDTVYHVLAGGWHLRPHGIIHTYLNATDKPARFIDMYFNQDFEIFLKNVSSTNAGFGKKKRFTFIPGGKKQNGQIVCSIWGDDV